MLDDQLSHRRRRFPDVIEKPIVDNVDVGGFRLFHCLTEFVNFHYTQTSSSSSCNVDKTYTGFHCNVFTILRPLKLLP